MAHPRPVPTDEQLGEQALRSFAADVGRPLVLVGNGPSASMAPLDRLPGDAVIARMNWFFLESHYHFGRTVDVWFYAIEHAELERRLREEIVEKRYDVTRICSPMRIPALRDGERWFSQVHDLGVTELDHWAVIAGSPRLARFCMSRPLPTTGMQALAFALGVGFREIYLCGIDLYESPEARYGWAIPEDIRGALQPKDLAPGYESKHTLDRDLAFLKTCLAEHPDAHVYTLSDSRNVRRLVDRAPELARGRRSLADGPDPSLGRPKAHLVLAPKGRRADRGPLELVDAPPDTRLYVERDGKRCAYVTLVAGHYHHGARALATSLRRVSTIPLLALCTPSADRTRLVASGIHCLDVPEIFNPNDLDEHTKRFAATYSKLNVFRLGFLDRAVFLDGDTIVMQNIDELFDGSGFAAAPDAGFTRPGSTFNAGVFSTDTSFELFDDMMDKVERLESDDHGDQGFLNSYFPVWNELDQSYNVTKRMYSHHPELFSLDEVKVLHYVGVKPWQPKKYPQRHAELDWQWMDNLSRDELRELIVDLRHEIAAEAVGGGEERGSLFRRAQARNLRGEHAEAERLLLAEWPEDEQPGAALERELATALRQQGRLAEALPHLEAAARIKPGSKGIGRDLRAVRSQLAAAQRPAVVDKPAAPRPRGSLLRRAQAHAAAEEWDAAERLLTAEWPGDEASAALERELAAALRRQGKLTEALAHLEAAAGKAPDSGGIAKELREVRTRLDADAGPTEEATGGLRDLGRRLRRG